MDGAGKGLEMVENLGVSGESGFEIYKWVWPAKANSLGWRRGVG
jgi:hypothetical protein